MDVIDELLANNAAFAARHDARPRGARPAKGLAVVTCMDSRLDLFALLGLRKGDAHILRNAGGVVTDDSIRSLAVSQRLLGTNVVMLIHHTNCGMQQVTDDGFRAELERSAGVAPSFAAEAFSDIDASVRRSITRVRESPFLLGGSVRGFVYDVESGRLREVGEQTQSA